MSDPRLLRLLVALLVVVSEVGITLLDYSTSTGGLTLLQSLPVVVASLVFGYTGYGASFVLALVLGVIVHLTTRGHGAVLSELDVVRLIVLALVGLAVAVASEDRRRLRELSRTDGLTGLANYRWFRETLDMEFLRSRRYGHQTSLILADVDKFKEVNDLYGHHAGNRVLRDLALILRQYVRDVDFPARFGGDEFAVILPETADQEAAAVAERVQRAVAEATFPVAHDLPVQVTMSLGVATYPTDATTPDELIAKADAALYAAKRSGRNGIKSA